MFYHPCRNQIDFGWSRVGLGRWSSACASPTRFNDDVPSTN
ncbi:hypothetical protein LINPERPRIM_LOCUS133 [Linum perenne]